MLASAATSDARLLIKSASSSRDWQQPLTRRRARWLWLERRNGMTRKCGHEQQSEKHCASFNCVLLPLLVDGRDGRQNRLSRSRRTPNLRRLKVFANQICAAELWSKGERGPKRRRRTRTVDISSPQPHTRAHRTCQHQAKKMHANEIEWRRKSVRVARNAPAPRPFPRRRSAGRAARRRRRAAACGVAPPHRSSLLLQRP